MIFFGHVYFKDYLNKLNLISESLCMIRQFQTSAVLRQKFKFPERNFYFIGEETFHFPPPVPSDLVKNIENFHFFKNRPQFFMLSY